MAMMETAEMLAIQTEDDVVRVRHAARRWSKDLGFGLVDQTKIVTAASELARNTLVYGLGGSVEIGEVRRGESRGLRLIFEDHGPGIPDPELALRDGFSTGSGLGLGLSGAQRLMSELTIDTRVGQGTRVSVTRWRQR